MSPILPPTNSIEVLVYLGVKPGKNLPRTRSDLTDLLEDKSRWYFLTTARVEDVPKCAFFMVADKGEENFYVITDTDDSKNPLPVQPLASWDPKFEIVLIPDTVGA